MFGKDKIKKEIYIDGMHCMHCAKSVEAALKGINGVGSVKVDLNNKVSIITSKEEISDNAIKVAIEAAGFTVTDIKTV